MSDGAMPQLSLPDSALASLDRMVGSWSIEGNLVGSDDKAIKGQTTFRGSRDGSYGAAVLAEHHGHGD